MLGSLSAVAATIYGPVRAGSLPSRREISPPIFVSARSEVHEPKREMAYAAYTLLYAKAKLEQSRTNVNAIAAVFQRARSIAQSKTAH